MPAHTTPVPPPSTHQLALMIWLAVFPTLVRLDDRAPVGDTPTTRRWLRESPTRSAAAP